MAKRSAGGRKGGKTKKAPRAKLQRAGSRKARPRKSRRRPAKTARPARSSPPGRARKGASRAARARTSTGRKRRSAAGRRGQGAFELPSALATRGLGPEAGGQAGDTEGLSRAEIADSESVEELIEEGQAFEAGVVSGVEDAPDADQGGVRTREVPEDDVPEEYRDRD